MSDSLAPIPGAPIDEDLDHERIALPVGRAARVGLGAVVLLALSGVFGGRGPLARTEASAGPPAAALTVRYDRFARLDAPTIIEIQLPPSDSTVTLGPDLAASLRLDTVQPAPASETSTPDGGLQLVGTPGETFRLHTRPLRAGRIAGTVALPGGRAAALRMLVYP